MPRWFDPSSPMGVDDVDATEERVIPRHARARRIAEQSWREYFKDLAIQSAVIVGGVAVLALVLTLLLR